MREQNASDASRQHSRSERGSWWAKSVDEALRAVDLADVRAGLSEDEAERRLAEIGPNVIERRKPRTWFQILLDQFRSTIMAILGAAAVAAFVFEGTADGLAVSAVILANALIGFFTELRAVRRMESLAELGGTVVSVRRDDRVREVPSDEVVPGDVFLVEEGLEIPADARIVESNRLLADESTLTGESEPVRKHTDVLKEETELMDRANMLFKGTFVTRGSGEAVVVATGVETELGEISQLVSESEEEHTPLERRLNTLARRLVYVTIATAVAATVSGIITGRGIVLMVETGIALAVAAIPEGLPIVATIALATALHEMAKRHALVNRLSSVETLGSTTVICTDKTGTLTENRLSVAEFAVAMRSGAASDSNSPERVEVGDAGDQSDDVRRAIERIRKVGALCTNVEAGTAVGDPLEVALVRDAEEAGLDFETLRDEEPEVQEIAFDSSLMEMATIHKTGDEHFAAVKGAPERVLDQCRDVDRERWVEIADRMSEDGLRVLAVARRSIEVSEERRLEPDDVYADLELLGLVGLRDPARPEVAEAIARCQAAGISVVMVTGDNPRTARAIGQEVGIIDDEHAFVVSGHEINEYLSSTEPEQETRVFARVTPKQKLAIVDWYQERGEIVAMTGDGVNDAPALERADIGVAMGDRGTDVAAESADMVLTDDALGSVVTAVRYGRIIFTNIRKFVIYLMSCNLAEIIAVGIAAVAVLPLPLRPLQILFLNVVTGVFPALALGVGPGSGEVMERPPRDPSSPVLESRHWRALIAFSALIAAAVLGAFLVALGPLELGEDGAVTVGFLTLAFSHVWHVFNMRGSRAHVLRNDIVANPWVWGAIALCLALVVAVATLPGISAILSLVTVSRSGWYLAVGASFLPLLAGPFVGRLVAGKSELFAG
ncbi:MAG: cation-translocating P-type ATPase [Spirochaetales bacterium]